MLANQRTSARLTGIAGRRTMPALISGFIALAPWSCVVFAQAPPAQREPAHAAVAIAAALREKGRFPEAVAVLEQAVVSAGSEAERRAPRTALADTHGSWAKILVGNYEHEAAIVHYRAAYEIDKELRPKAAGVELGNIGKVCSNIGENHEALAYFEQALAIHLSAGDRQGEAVTLDNIGEVYSNLGEKQRALGYFEQALTIHRAVGDRQGEAAALSNIGGVYQDLDEKQKALGYYQQALPIQRAVGDRAGEAATLDGMGDVYADLDEVQKALGYYEQALPIQRAVGDRKGEAATLSSIGDRYDDLDERQKALGYYEQALPIQRAVGDRAGEAATLNGIGLVYDELGEDEKALGYYERALPIQRSVGDRAGEALTLSHIGGVYDDLGDKQNALRYYEQALPIQRAVGDRLNEAATLSSIGGVYADLGERQKALAYYEQALPMHRAVGDRSGEAETLGRFGKVYDELGERQKALDRFAQALAIHRAVIDRWREAVTLRHIGKVYSNLGERQKALGYYEHALPIDRVVGNRTGEAKTAENLMWEWNALSKPRLAIFYGKQAVNLYQQLRGDIRGLPKELQHTYLKTVEGTYRSLADLLVAQERLPEAQQVLDLLKQEEYFEFVRRASSEASSLDSRATLTPTEAEWQRRYAAVADQAAELGRRRGDLARKKVHTAEEDVELGRLDADLEVAGKAFQGFLDQLTQEFGTTDSGRERVFQVREAQGLMEDLRELGAGAVALYTLVGEKSTRIILITPDVEKAAEYRITKAELASKVQAFREALMHPSQDPRPLAQELYRIVVGPIAKDLVQAGAQTLMWSLDGVLRYLPIAALHDGEMYLLERYRSVVFTPASNARLKDQPAARWRGLGLGVSHAAEGFRALPSVALELRGIFRDERSKAGVMPGTVLLDEAFTAEAMKAAIRKGVPLVHVASHFRFAPGNETESFLLLGDRDKTKNHLTLDQVRTSANLFGGVELLTLSACQTAIGGGANGTEVEGFAVLAQRQGAKAVIATLWSVDDASTSLLMREFYRLREAASGTSKAEALRQAQLALLHGRIRLTSDEAAEGGLELPNPGSSEAGSLLPRFAPDPAAPYAHPHYWAPFILIGNWR